MTDTIKPVDSAERAEILDVLRGIAILGIFIANSAVFSLYVFQPNEVKEAMPNAGLNDFLFFMSEAFIGGKFYSLFSLLFGIGFSIILDRNLRAGRNPLAIFYRRITVMIAIGLCHALLLWEGDILLLYALIALFLPLFRNVSDRKLIITAVFLLFSPVVIDLIKVLSEGAWNPAAFFFNKAVEVDARNGITETNFRTWLIDHPDYHSVRSWLQGGFFWRWEMIVASNRIPKVLAMFLIGYVAGRRNIFSSLEENLTLIRKVVKYGFIIGIPASFAMVYFTEDSYRLPDWRGLLETLFYAISVVPLSLAITGGITLLWLRPRWQKMLLIFAPAGRMALTNYIMQSVFAVGIYWGVGLGLATKFGPSGFIPVALGVYLFQVVFSGFWFRVFRYGPLEWLWRMLTYGKYFRIQK